MSDWKSACRVLVGVGLGMLSLPLAQATTYNQITTSFTCSGANCDSVNWENLNGGTSNYIVNGTFNNNGIFTTAGNNGVEATDGGGNAMIWYEQGTSPWPTSVGYYSPSQPIIATNNPGSGSGDTITLTFLNGSHSGIDISDFGAYIQAFAASQSFTAEITAINGTTLGTPFQYSSNGSPIWVGVADPGGNNTISSLTFTVVNSGSNYYFAIGPAIFSTNGTIQTNPPTVTTPEPGTWALMIGGLLGVGWKARRRVRA